MKQGTKINHIVTIGKEMAEKHSGCSVILNIKGAVDANGMIIGAHSLTLTSPEHTITHHNVSLDTMIVVTQEWSKSLG